VSGRKSKLIINAHNILLRVINANLSRLQFITVLIFVLHCFTIYVQRLLGGILQGTAVTIDGLQLEMGLLVSSFHGEIRTKSL
jgi:hypothetical protein